MDEWIKMRVNLGRDPKLLAIAKHLASDPEFCRWLVRTTALDCPKSALEIVPLECVVSCVVSALLVTWGIANARGKIAGSDLVLRYAERRTIDEIANLPGLASAMETVKWLVCDDARKVVTFPDFLAYNVPSEDREKRLRRERQARWRSSRKKPPERRGERRQKSPVDVVVDVYKSVASDAQMRVDDDDASSRASLSSRSTTPKDASSGSIACNRSSPEPDANVPEDWQAFVDVSRRAQGEVSNAEAVSSWNSLARRHGLRQISKLTDARRKALRARIRELPDFWRRIDEALGRLGTFAREKGFVDFDFVVSASRLTRLLEGRYEDDPRRKTLAEMSDAELEAAYGGGNGAGGNGGEP